MEEEARVSLKYRQIDFILGETMRYVKGIFLDLNQCRHYKSARLCEQDIISEAWAGHRRPEISCRDRSAGCDAAEI